MALTDLMLKAKVNLALVRDPRVGALDIGVQAEDGVVTLTGDLDTPHECHAAEEIARKVEGVRAISSQITCGVGMKQDTAEMVSQRFLEKLDEEWTALAESTALAQADYVKWALWMIYKFRIPDANGSEAAAEAQARATDEAIKAVAGRIGSPPALIALELDRVAMEADAVPNSEGPRLLHSDLVTTPLVDEGNSELAA